MSSIKQLFLLVFAFLSVVVSAFTAEAAGDFAPEIAPGIEFGVAGLPTPRQETVVCIGVDGEVRFDVQVEIPNLTNSPMALTMRASDPNVAAERSEIALFDANEGLLNNDNGVIVGYVDPKHPHTSRKGERIGGTNLGQLRSVMLSLEIDFDVAASPLKKYSAQALYLKKTGEQLVQDLDCTRQR